MMTIYVAEGSDPRTKHVELCNAETHVAARDRFSCEAEILLAYAESEECQLRDPIGFKWNDPVEDARFIFDEDDMLDVEREGALTRRIEVVQC